MYSVQGATELKARLCLVRGNGRDFPEIEGHLTNPSLTPFSRLSIVVSRSYTFNTKPQNVDIQVSPSLPRASSNPVALYAEDSPLGTSPWETCASNCLPDTPIHFPYTY